MIQWEERITNIEQVLCNENAEVFCTELSDMGWSSSSRFRRSPSTLLFSLSFLSHLHSHKIQKYTRGIMSRIRGNARTGIPACVTKRLVLTNTSRLTVVSLVCTLFLFCFSREFLRRRCSGNFADIFYGINFSVLPGFRDRRRRISA